MHVMAYIFFRLKLTVLVLSLNVTKVRPRLSHMMTKTTQQLSFFIMCVLTGCSVEEALGAASLHPAQLLRIGHKKGTLDYGSDAGQDLQSSSLHCTAITVKC